MQYIDEATSGKRISFKGFAVADKNAKFTPFESTRHALGNSDILIEILFPAFATAIFTLPKANGVKVFTQWCPATK